MESRPRKLLDQVRDAIRLKHYSYRTEQSYVGWIRRYIFFYNKQHSNDMGGAELEAFLTHLAVEGHVSASTQYQAFSALLFLHRNVLRQELGALDAVRAKRSNYLIPTVTSATNCSPGHWGGFATLPGLAWPVGYGETI